MSRIYLVLFLFLFFQTGHAQDRRAKWVDSIFNKLSKTEKIGQLISVSYASNSSTEEAKLLTELVHENKIGALTLAHGSPVFQVKFVNTIQSLAKIPVLIGAQLSDGLPSVMDSTMSFYNPAVVNALTNDTLVSELNAEIARQIKLLGINQVIKKRAEPLTDLTPFQDKKNGDLELQRLIANSEFIFLSPSSVDPFIKLVLKTTKKKNFPVFLLDSAAKKILTKKYEAHVDHFEKLSTDNLIEKLHQPSALLLKEQIAAASIKIAGNAAGVIPVKRLDDKTFSVINIGEPDENEFTRYLQKYAAFNPLSIKALADTSIIHSQVKASDFLVIGLFSKVLAEQPAVKNLIGRLSKQHQISICQFYTADSVYTKNLLVILCHDRAEGIPKAAVEKIFGGSQWNRFSYAIPEDGGMDSHTLDKIESIANEAIAMGATPGCHVLIARHEKVVYERSFGSLSYNKKNPVTDETIYDLASVTKVSATLQAIMYLYDKGMIDLNKKASVYLPELKGSNKEDMIIKDILTHQAGLWPYLPFWEKTVKDSVVHNIYYGHKASPDFPFPVADHLFAAKSMKDSLWQWIIKSKIRDKSARSVYDYRYSDMGFYIMQHLAEKMLNMPLEIFLQKIIYQPIGAYTTGYLPLQKFQPDRIAPTENDTLFRKSLLVGYVHDQGAAMHGGIAGHAGLFSSANDLAKLGQLWLNKGSYGGVQIFKPETVDFFTAKQYEGSRRGLGWDKPVLNDWSSPTSLFASSKTFGHTGFTGTCIWVDPEFDLIYVFLSNRVNPDMNNAKLIRANIRPRIQDVVYQSIFNYCK
ncbi:MAG: beta-glycosyl hydrolase / Uncharacterized esterase [Cytophagales bacterium]|jgi:CubicO group peptidase (beta-lactamase class C family)|nr:serine hydrolase [Bacteroidota bacterium]MBS1979661.1 serine hydrolase [Bacteroidota bacterium]WHZ06914.1 MAG: beta-glycosyl hydrolase / Uncharacterized esterase [Cytophagales bacterium]